MRCNQCNQLLPDDSEFCQYCGNKILLQEEEPNDMGLNENNPVSANGINAEYEYIEKLSSENGEKIKWTRKGSKYVPSLDAMIDVYYGDGVKGNKYGPIYINMYADYTEKTPVKGYEFISKVNTQETHKEENKRSSLNEPDNQGEINNQGEIKNKTTRKKYCSVCGGIIDNESKVCLSCGKKYFSIKRVLGKTKIVWVILCGIIIAGLIGLNIYQYKLINNKNSQISEINKEMAELEEEVNKKASQEESENREKRNLEAEIEYLNQQLTEETPEWKFYKEKACIVCDDGTGYFHRYGCKRCDLSYFWIYNINKAEQLGYSPCPDCSNYFDYMKALDRVQNIKPSR